MNYDYEIEKRYHPENFEVDQSETWDIFTDKPIEQLNNLVSEAKRITKKYERIWKTK